MSAVTLAGGGAEVSIGRRRCAPFAALLAKDLRLAAIVVVPCLAILVVLAAFAALVPLFGDGAARALGVPAWARQDALERIGSLAAVYWTISAFACVLSVLVIAAGDIAGRARHLVPALPAATATAYGAKLCAAALIVAGFTAISAYVESVSPDSPSIDFGLCAGIVSVGVIWGFASPLFARSFAGAFVTATIVPLAIFLGCLLTATALASITVREALLASGAAEFYGGGGRFGPYEQGLYRESVRDAALFCATLTVAFLGFWAAFKAHGIALCRRTPAHLCIGRALKAAGAVLLAALVASVATAAWAWNADTRIAPAVETARLVEVNGTRSTPQLIERYAELRGAVMPSLPASVSSDVPIWSALLQPSSAMLADEGHGSRELEPELNAVFRLLQDRRSVDGGAVREALAAWLSQAVGAGVASRLAIAELVGPATALSEAIAALAVSTDEVERAMLIDAIDRHALPVLLPRSAHATTHEATHEATGAATEAHSEDQSNGAREAERRVLKLERYGLVRHRLRDFGVSQQYPSVEARASAFLVITVLERWLREGTLVSDDPSRPLDRIVVDADTLRKALAMADQPLPGLAMAAGVISISPVFVRIERATDNETLHLRTSELFEGARVDPVQLHLRSMPR
jgi:hypothetical protein